MLTRSMLGIICSYRDYTEPIHHIMTVMIKLRRISGCPHYAVTNSLSFTERGPAFQIKIQMKLLFCNIQLQSVSKSQPCPIPPLIQI